MHRRKVFAVLTAAVRKQRDYLQHSPHHPAGVVVETREDLAEAPVTRAGRLNTCFILPAFGYTIHSIVNTWQQIGRFINEQRCFCNNNQF
jgi:hypothetical protein